MQSPTIAGVNGDNYLHCIPESHIEIAVHISFLGTFSHIYMNWHRTEEIMYCNVGDCNRMRNRMDFLLDIVMHCTTEVRLSVVLHYM